MDKELSPEVFPHLTKKATAELYAKTTEPVLLSLFENGYHHVLTELITDLRIAYEAENNNVLELLESVGSPVIPKTKHDMRAVLKKVFVFYHSSESAHIKNDLEKLINVFNKRHGDVPEHRKYVAKLKRLMAERNALGRKLDSIEDHIDSSGHESRANILRELHEFRDEVVELNKQISILSAKMNSILKESVKKINKTPKTKKQKDNTTDEKNNNTTKK